jgi:uncharacterized membrane protein YqgA involved in biofilm formation
MTGTLLNVGAILIGGTLGLLFGSRIPDKLKYTVIAGIGLFTAAIGLQMFLETKNPLAVLGAILIGSLLGEWWKIEDGLRKLGQILESRFARDTEADSSSRFLRGFLTASLLFCIGPLSILGSIQDGLTGDYQTLAIKSILDGFASMAFASTLGMGVLFSAMMVLFYQGGISLLASQLSTMITNPMISEMTATGGVILLGLAISNLLEIKPIRMGNFLPALAVAPLIVLIVGFIQK